MPTATAKPATQLPAAYVPGFLAAMDRRSAAYRELREAYDGVVRDCGGEAELSVVKLALIERFCFMDALLAKWEAAIAENPTATADLVGKWTAGVNALHGLARTIGLKRIARTGGLAEVLEELA